MVETKSNANLTDVILSITQYPFCEISSTRMKRFIVIIVKVELKSKRKNQKITVTNVSIIIICICLLKLFSFVIYIHVCLLRAVLTCARVCTIV